MPTPSNLLTNISRHTVTPARNVAPVETDSIILDDSPPLLNNDDISIDALSTDLTSTSSSSYVPSIEEIVHSSSTSLDDTLLQPFDPFSTPLDLDLSLTKPVYPTLSDHFPIPPSQPSFEPFSQPFLSSTPTFSSPAFSHVPYTYYPFLHLDPISHLPADDINFLERKKCFHIPTRSIVDEFVSKYFLHIHPTLPHINEGEFWHMYLSIYPRKRASNSTSSSGTSDPSNQLSLFVFQAMLFAASSFVSPSTLVQCGFTSIRSARTSFYRRAKFLYDFNTEHNPFCIAQGAGLLSMFVSDEQHQVNSSWLSIAIANARSASCHLYSHALDRSILEPERRRRKRVWWALIMQDRIIALGLRRPLQITSEQFGFETQEMLNEEDFQEEVGRSRVYDAEAKGRLVRVVLALARLARTLTGTIDTVYPQNGFSQLAVGRVEDKDGLEEAERKVKKAKEELEEWFKWARKSVESAKGGEGKENENVTLYTNIMFMYYYGAKSALGHHEALLVETHLPHALSTHNERLEAVANELQTASNDISKLFKEIMGLKVAKHMPISAVAYIAFPLVLHTLDLKLSPSSSPSSPIKQQLDFYSEAMRICEARYEGTGKLAAIVKKLVAFAANESRRLIHYPPSSSQRAASPGAGGKGVKDWLEVLVRHPKLYLRVSLSLDISMSRGRYPSQQDIPEKLLFGDWEDGRLVRRVSGSEGTSPNWSVATIPKSLGNISLGFSVSPAGLRSPMDGGYEVNLDFMEINVNNELVEEE